MFIIQIFGTIDFLGSSNTRRRQPAPPAAPPVLPPAQQLGERNPSYVNPALFLRRNSTIMCHQPQQQSEGFRLSLRGFDPDLDRDQFLRLLGNR